MSNQGNFVQVWNMLLQRNNIEKTSSSWTGPHKKEPGHQNTREKVNVRFECIQNDGYQNMIL